MDLQYIVNASDPADLPHGRILVDKFAVLWSRPGPNSFWEDGTGRARTVQSLLTMRGPIYLLPEGFTGALTLDDLIDAEAGDYLIDCHGDRWSKTTNGRWLLDDGFTPGIVKKPADLLAVYSPLLPSPRPGDFYVRPVSAMEAAAREEEARPVGFWRRLWNGLVWG
ncbi:MAG: hypothetical protein ABS888_00155 [Eubacteriales bacterium]